MQSLITVVFYWPGHNTLKQLGGLDVNMSDIEHFWSASRSRAIYSFDNLKLFVDLLYAQDQENSHATDNSNESGTSENESSENENEKEDEKPEEKDEKETEQPTEQPEQQKESETEDEKIEKELVAELNLNDDELNGREGNDSETVEIGSKEDEAENAERNKKAKQQATEELSARRISELGGAQIESGKDWQRNKELTGSCFMIRNNWWKKCFSIHWLESVSQNFCFSINRLESSVIE